MKSRSWLESLFGNTMKRNSRRAIRSTRRLRLESLEDRTTPSGAASLTLAYGNLPLAFEANEGQAGALVDFLARGEGYMLSLASGAAVLDLRQESGHDQLSMQLVGSNPATAVFGQDELVTKTNYLIGSDPSQWHTNIANYGKVMYDEVYAGIDLVYYGTNQRQLEYDFIVAPGADPKNIALRFEGATEMHLDADGNLVLHTVGGDVVQHAPIAYQESDGVRHAVASHYVLQDDGQVGFEVGAYDASQTLTIDPILSYSTYLGGSGDDTAYGIAVDTAGNAYIVGRTDSTNFPTVNPLQPVMAGDPVATYDAFVSKLNAAGTALVYSTYLGGTQDEQGYGIAVDAGGNAYLTGYTTSGDYPTTANAFQGSANPNFQAMAFMTKLNSTGSALLYSSLLGSTTLNYASSTGQSIAVDGAGNAYVTGQADYDFPTTPGAFQTSGDFDAFVAKFDPSQAGTASLAYSTLLGGTGSDTGYGIAVDSTGNAYVTGSAGYADFPTTPGALQTTYGGSGWDDGDAFVTKLNATGSALIYSTFLGGSSSDYGWAVAVDSTGNAYVTGASSSANFPTTFGAAQPTKAGGMDAFVAKLNSTGSALAYSTFLGGSDYQRAYGIAVDASGSAYVTGHTTSTNFPTTANAVQPTKGGDDDAFVVKLNSAGSALAYSTYLGGSGVDYGFGIGVDSVGNAYVAGMAISGGFPTTPGAMQRSYGGGFDDTFVAKIDMTLSPFFSVSGFPSPRTAGVAGTFTVTARDVNGNVDTAYTGTVHFTSSDPQAVLPADYTFTAADQGVRTFSATLKTAGSQAIDATDTANATVTGTQWGITVNAAATSKLLVSGFPSSTTAGVAGNFIVTASDAYGNRTTGYRGSVSFTSNDAQAVLPRKYSFTAADAGQHTFSATLKTAGTRSITAKDSANASITGMQTGITVNPAAASKFVISAPATVTAGATFSLTLTVRDAYGNIATGYRGTVRFTSTDGTASLPANYTFTAADNGVHTFTGLVLRKKGKQKIIITDVLDSSLTATVTENVI